MQETIDIVYYWLQDAYGLFSVKIITAILIIFVGFVLGKIVKHAVEVLVKEAPFEKDIKNYLQLNRYPSEILGSLASYIIDFAIFVGVLYVLDLTKVAFYSLIVISIFVLVIFILLNLKEFGPNTYAYYRLLKEYDMQKGRRFTLQDLKLKVEKIDRTQVTALTESGDVVTVHNRTVIKALTGRNQPKSKKVLKKKGKSKKNK